MYEALLELDIKNLSRLLLHSRLFVLTVEICLLELLFGDLKCVCFEGLHVLSFPRSIHFEDFSNQHHDWRLCRPFSAAACGTFNYVQQPGSM